MPIKKCSVCDYRVKKEFLYCPMCPLSVGEARGWEVYERKCITSGFSGCEFHAKTLNFGW